MKKFLEPEVQILNFDQEIILGTSPTNPTEGGGTTDFDVTNLG